MEHIFVRWVPALITKEIQEAFEILVSICPRSLVQMCKHKDREAKRARALIGSGGSNDERGEMNLEPISKKEQVTCLVGLIVKHTIASRTQEKLGGLRSPKGYPVSVAKFVDKDQYQVMQMFFEFGEPTARFTNSKSADYFQVKEIPMTIHVWLSRLFLGEKDHRIRLLVKNYQLMKKKERAASRLTSIVEPGDGTLETEADDYFSIAVEIEMLPKKTEPRGKAKPNHLGGGDPMEVGSEDLASIHSQQVAIYTRSKTRALQKFLSLKSIPQDTKMDVLAHLNLLSEHIPGFERALSELNTSSGNGAESLSGSILSRSAFADEGLGSPEVRELRQLERADLDELQQQQPSPSDETQQEGESRAANQSHDLLRLHYSQFGDVFTRVFPLLESLGIKLVLPRFLRKKAQKPRLRMRVRSAAGNTRSSSDGTSSAKTVATQGFAGITDDLSFDWTIAIGDQDIPVHEFEKMVKGQEGMVKIMNQFVVLEKDEMNKLFTKLKTVPPKLTNMQVVQAALTNQLNGESGILGKDVECDIESKITDMVLRKLNLMAGQAVTDVDTANTSKISPQNDVFPLYSRPVIEKCLRDVAEELEGKIYPEIIEIPVIHDGHTFDAMKELNGVERIDPRLQKACCKLRLEVITHKSGSSARQGSFDQLVSQMQSWSTGSPAPSIQRDFAGKLQLQPKGLNVIFHKMGNFRISEEDKWVPNPMTRKPISQQKPPMMNYRIQGIIDLFEMLMPEAVMQEKARKANSCGVSAAREIIVESVSRELANFSEFSNEKLSEVFHQLKKLCRAESGASDITYTNVKEYVDTAAKDPCCKISYPEGWNEDEDNAESAFAPQSSTQTPSYEVPANLSVELREYQKRGFRWLCHNIEFGFGSILADDMGLGKTIQVISALLYFKNAVLADVAAHAGGTVPVMNPKTPKFLVVCPTSLIDNWQHEVEKFAPSLKIVAYHGNDRARCLEAFRGNTTHLKKNAVSSLSRPDTGEPPMKRGRLARARTSSQSSLASTQSDMQPQDPDILVTSLAVARLDAKELSKVDWFLLILDEAQNIKNPHSHQTKAIKSIAAKNFIAMSGTPVENRLLEYWSIFDFTNRGYLGPTVSNFASTYAKLIENENCKATLDKFHRITKPFILRRVKTDRNVINDLPEKVYCNETCRLSFEQAGLYESITKQYLNRLDPSYEVGPGETKLAGIARKGMVLKMLLDLKQICDHPALYLKNEDKIDKSGSLIGEGFRKKRTSSLGSGQLSRLSVAVEDSLSASIGTAGTQAMDVNSPLRGIPSESRMSSSASTDLLSTPVSNAGNSAGAIGKHIRRQRCSTAASQKRTASPPGSPLRAAAFESKESLNCAVSRSGKCEALLQILSNVLAQNEKAIIFTQYIGMGVLLSRILESKFLEKFPFFHGGLNLQERNSIVAHFQKPEGRIRAMIISLKAGGTGLNLTAASHVIHFDHWWNPAVEDQATDRAYRIGQSRKVFVYRLLSAGTLEEKIMRMMDKKRILQDLTVKSGENWLTEMSADDLREMVSLSNSNVANLVG
eukprot:TRINITY_DN43019_c0_g1_i1.p1 TRINITY_DN43019_c0_g1~~TRINITY_DN43019_c0_g1_i1.p1  ORF type:complete len:1693 (-),score=213.64 TRINITY_DN43019_c0_g1_i1:421-5022(-)